MSGCGTYRGGARVACQGRTSKPTREQDSCKLPRQKKPMFEKIEKYHSVLVFLSVSSKTHSIDCIFIDAMVPRQQRTRATGASSTPRAGCCDISLVGNTFNKTASGGFNSVFCFVTKKKGSLWARSHSLRISLCFYIRQQWIDTMQPSP
ncbi:unnamed protein product, partial [Ectocarpus sp. 4 AP-2014]